MQSSKKENKRRSRAITAIIKEIGREKWNTIPTKEKNVLIKAHITKTKKFFKEEREKMKAINREYRGIVSV
jgi:hypothetical protein